MSLPPPLVCVAHPALIPTTGGCTPVVRGGVACLVPLYIPPPSVGVGGEAGVMQCLAVYSVPVGARAVFVTAAGPRMPARPSPFTCNVFALPEPAFR